MYISPSPLSECSNYIIKKEDDSWLICTDRRRAKSPVQGNYQWRVRIVATSLCPSGGTRSSEGTKRMQTRLGQKGTDHNWYNQIRGSKEIGTRLEFERLEDTWKREGVGARTEGERRGKHPRGILSLFEPKFHRSPQRKGSRLRTSLDCQPVFFPFLSRLTDSLCNSRNGGLLEPPLLKTSRNSIVSKSWKLRRWGPKRVRKESFFSLSPMSLSSSLHPSPIQVGQK